MNEPYREVAYGHARLHTWYLLYLVYCPALLAWPACWSPVAWEPEWVQASPCRACPTFPKGKGPEGQLRGGDGPIGPKVSRPLPQLFEFPRPIPPWNQHQQKKHRQSRPFRRTAPHPRSQCARRSDGRQALASSATITDEHSHEFPSPVGRPVCPCASERHDTPLRSGSKFKVEVEVKLRVEVKSSSRAPTKNGRATPPAQGTDSDHRPQTKKNPHWESHGAGLSRP